MALFANQFQQIRRESVRSAEATVLAAGGSLPVRTLKQQRAALEQLRPVLDKNYPTLSGEERALRFMTRSQLQARREMLMKQSAGISHAIEVIDRALALCEAAHVDRLADIQEAA